MGRPQLYSDSDVIRAMEDEFILHGYAAIGKVADGIGCSRVYLSQRLSQMRKTGKITPEQYAEWRSPASKAQQLGAQPTVRLNVRLSPENHEWLVAQSNSASATMNSLIERARA